LRRNIGRWKRETWHGSSPKGGGSVAAQQQRAVAPVKEGRCHQLGELHRDHGELLDLPTEENDQQDEPSLEMRKKGENRGLAAAAYRRWRRGGAGWTRCREGALYNGVCVRATRSYAAASAWCSSSAGIRRTQQQRRTGLLGARAQLAGGSAQQRRQVLGEGLLRRSRLDVLDMMWRSEEGKWQLHASKGSSEQWPSGTRHRHVRQSSCWQQGIEHHVARLIGESHARRSVPAGNQSGRACRGVPAGNQSGRACRGVPAGIHAARGAYSRQRWRMGAGAARHTVRHTVRQRGLVAAR
jgi:hypothetical protein